MPLSLTQEAARIFRITHIANLPWVLANGLHSRASGAFDPAHRNIGDIDLIARRARRVVPCDPGGTLSDYVPFYFTSRSPMLLNIKTGFGVAPVRMNEIVVLVSSLHAVLASGSRFVFTDRHAYLANAEFFTELAALDKIDWDILVRSDFKRSLDDFDKKARYEAEALVYRHLPVSALTGILCVDEAQAARCRELVDAAGYSLPVAVKPAYFF